jgi:Holliday junction resolvase RusA-like endonuclease
MEHTLIILGRLPGINDYTAANRQHYRVGADMKKDAQDTIIWQIRNQLRGLHITKPVMIKYMFFEPNKKRDLDNIAGFAHKVIQDSLVNTKVIANDGWGNVVGFLDQFALDKENPRIEVTIVEVG